MAALSGSLGRIKDGEIALKHPALQIFERKARPAAAPEAKASEPNGSEVEAPAENASIPAPPYPKLTLKERGAAKAG
ncbi:MAG: hypothetical protein V9G18_22050 [Albidovulum sp.]